MVVKRWSRGGQVVVKRGGVDLVQTSCRCRGAGAEVLQMCCRGAVGAELHEEVVQRCANVLMISR